jgi:hypothetical protein
MNRLLFEREKKKILSEISHLEPRIHRAVFSGNHSYNRIEQLGRLKINNDHRQVTDHNGDFIKYRTAYKTFANTWLGGKLISILTNPPAPYYPSCMIEVTDPTQEWLFELNLLLQCLGVSSVEYAMDIFLHEPNHSGLLTEFLSQYLHCGHKRSTRIEENLNTIQSNTVIHYSSHHGLGKIYTRGPDNKKIGDGWKIQDCDRVRIEFKATSDYYLKQEFKTSQCGKYQNNK